MSKKEKKEFSREYIPVVIAILLLIVLAVGLIYAISYKGKLKLEDVPEKEHTISELNVDIDKNKCDANTLKNLKNEVSKIKMVTSEKTKIEKEKVDDEEVESTYHIWNVEFENMSDNFYIKVTNNLNDDIITINKDNLLDGKWAFDTISNIKVATYTISIISNVDNCKEQIFKKFEFIALIYNGWYNYSQCSHYPEFEYCKKYTDKDVLSYSEFIVELNKYLESHPDIEVKNPYDDILPDGKTTTTKKSK